MNCKKFLVSSMILASVLCSATNAFASEIQAKVEKSYVEIDKLLEYNEYERADKMISDALKQNPKDVQLKALRTVSLAKQYKLAPAQTELDALLKDYPNNPDLHYAQGIVFCSMCHR